MPESAAQIGHDQISAVRVTPVIIERRDIHMFETRDELTLEIGHKGILPIMGYGEYGESQQRFSTAGLWLSVRGIPIWGSIASTVNLQSEAMLSKNQAFLLRLDYSPRGVTPSNRHYPDKSEFREPIRRHETALLSAGTIVLLNTICSDNAHR